MEDVVGHNSLWSASRMNKAIVIFVDITAKVSGGEWSGDAEVLHHHLPAHKLNQKRDDFQRASIYKE